MSNKKSSLPSDINLDELADIAATPSGPAEEPVIIHVSDVVRFMLINELKPGAHPVQSSLIYKVYYDWSKNPKTRNSFSMELYKYIPHGNVHGLPVCYVNQGSFKLARTIQSLEDNTKTDKTKSKKWQKHFENFLSHYGITAGKKFVPMQAIWHLYDVWSHQISKKHPFGYKSLSAMCVLYFEKKRVGADRGAWYGVSENITEHITKEQLDEIKQGQKRTRKKAIEKTKKNKEKSS